MGLLEISLKNPFFIEMNRRFLPSLMCFGLVKTDSKLEQEEEHVLQQVQVEART